jgi:hypothetical protein
LVFCLFSPVLAWFRAALRTLVSPTLDSAFDGKVLLQPSAFS